MKQILLAIDGEEPSQPVFQYAADLCRQIRAELCILQFTREKQARQARNPRACEDRMGFSSAPARLDNGTVSAPLKHLLKTAGPAVPFRVALSPGSIENGLSDYIDTHHDVILTVYDPAQDPASHWAARINAIKGKLGVPLVIVRAAETRGVPALRT